MNVMPLLFWLALLLPGAAVARRLIPQELRGGVLPSMAVSWMTTFVVLAPVVIVGYLVRVPTAPMAALLAVFIMWGAIDLLRARAWVGTRHAVVAIIGIAGAVVLIDLVLAERVGAILNNDARVHIARIRFLVEHGLSNGDPFIQGPVEFPYPIYHTNILHALHAIACKLMFIDPLQCWFGSLGASRLMIASAGAYLAWVVLGGSWAPLVAALMVVVHRAPYDYTLYPNQLAPWFAIPIAVAVAIRLLSAPRDVHALSVVSVVFIMAGVAAVVGMIHPLYAGFLVVIVAPIAGAVGLWRLIRGMPGAVAALMVTVTVVVVGGLFPLAAKTMTASESASGYVARPSERELARRARDRALNAQVPPSVANTASPTGVPGNADAEGRDRGSAVQSQDGFTTWQFGDTQWVSRTFGRGFTGGLFGIPGWRLLVMAIGTFLAVRMAHRREALLLAATIGVVQAVVMTPPLCTEAIRFLGAQWMVSRFEALAFVLWIPLSVPALAAVLEGIRPWRAGKALLLSSTIAVLALFAAVAHASFVPPYSLAGWLERGMASRSARLDDRYRGLVEQQEWMRQAIPDDAVVACGRLTGTWVAMLRGSALVCSERSSTGVPRGATRVRQAAEMLDDRTDEARRSLLFRHYGVTHAVMSGRVPAWVEYWAFDQSTKHGHTVVTLRSEPNPALRVEAQIADLGRDIIRGRAEDAHDRLLVLVEQHPAIARGWYQLGNAEMSLGQYVAAERAYAMARSLAPTDPRIVLMLGNAFQAQGRIDDAIADFRTTLVLATDVQDDGLAASACFNLGNALVRGGRKAEAVVEFQRALHFDPEHLKAIEALKVLGVSQTTR